MKTKLASLIVIVLLMSLVLANCAPAPTPAPEPTQAPVQEQTEAPVADTEAPATEAAKPPAPEYIELGASIPLTGPFGSLGNLVLPGYEFAVEDINAAGGVYVEEYGTKIPLRLTYYDDESDPTKAVSKMETLYSDQNVTAYLGGAGSSMHAATTAIAEKNKVPYCGISFALYKIHQQGYKYLFSPFPKSPQQAKDTFEVLNSIPEADRPKQQDGGDAEPCREHDHRHPEPDQAVPGERALLEEHRERPAGAAQPHPNVEVGGPARPDRPAPRPRSRPGAHSRGTAGSPHPSARRLRPDLRAAIHPPVPRRGEPAPAACADRATSRRETRSSPDSRCPPRRAPPRSPRGRAPCRSRRPRVP